MDNLDQNPTSTLTATRRLSAIGAAFNQIDTPLQVPMAQLMLERGLDQLQFREESFHEFVAECALLAADNLQDVRLQDLERRMASAERAGSGTPGDILLSVALNFALQLGTVAAVSMIANLVLAFMKQRELGRVMTRQFVHAVAQRPAAERLLPLHDERASLQTTADFLGPVFDYFRHTLGETQPVELTFRGEEVKLYTAMDTLSFARQVRARLDEIDDQILLTQPLAGSEQDLKAIDRIINAYQEGLNGAELRQGAWQEFFNGAGGNIALGPAQTLVNETLSTVMLGDAARPDAGVFLSSIVTARILSWTARERLMIKEKYSALRLFARYGDPAKLSSNPIAREILGMVTSLVPQWDTFRAMMDVVRPAMVTGFEAAFWYEYLQSNGMLEGPIPQKITRQAFYYSPVGVGAIEYGYVIRELPPSPGRVDYTVDFYPGLLQMSEMQTLYLYDRFAKPYYDRIEEAPPVPFDYTPELYAGVSVTPPYGLLPSSEWHRLLDQMRLIVLLYFKTLESGAVDDRLDSVLGEGAALRVKDWFDSRARGVPPGPADASRVEADMREAASTLQVFLAASDKATATDLQLRVLQFADQVTDLNLDVLNHRLLVESAETPLPPQPTAEDVAQEIEEELMALGRSYDEIKGLLHDDPELLKSFEATYEKSVTSLLQWQATDAQSSQWRWYGPEPQP